MTIEGLFKAEQPVVPRRGVHLDLKGVPPTARRLVELVEVIAAARYNVILVEWEDAFPWTVDQRFRSKTAYAAEDIRRLYEAAQKRGITIIPLVQCLGHMETPLSVPGYEHLREVPDEPAVLNPLAPGAQELVQRMVDDVLNVIPEVRYFHLGGDEAGTFGTHPDTKAYIARHGKGALYLRHIGPILDRLNARGIRPILWHDMMINWDSAALRALAPRSDLMVWGYSGNPDTTVHHFNTRYIQRFSEHGLTLWGATAYKGADGQSVDRPNLARRQENAEAWMPMARRFGLAGVIATGWSRYSTRCLQCEPIDAALDSLVNIGVVLHDGQAPLGGVAAFVGALDAMGEGARFRDCRAAMQLLTAVRQNGWQECQALRELNVLHRMDPQRTGANAARQALSYLGNIMGTGEEAEGKVRQAFAGLIEPLWIEEYLKTRLAPLRDEFANVTRAWKPE